MIEIYPSKLQGAPLEKHCTTSPMTVEGWLRANVPAFERRESPPISVEINGALIDPAEWDTAEFAPDDVVAIRIEPKGAELFIAAVTLQATFNFVTGLFMPKMPSQPKNNARAGDKLSEAAAKGNKVKLNSPIREIAGRRKVYPDYLLPPRRYFKAGDPKSQWVEMLLCIGKGKYQINASEIQVGDTPIISLGADAEYAIYQPGASMAAEKAAEWWHSSTEVGSTSSGTAGLELRATYTVDPVVTASSYILSGDTITIPSGAGSIPDGWAAGMIVRIEAAYPYTVTDGGAARDIIEGDFSQLAPFVDMTIEIIGDNEGLYKIASYTPPVAPSTTGQITLSYANGAAVTTLKTGSVSMGIGYAGLRYRLKAAGTSSIAVDRLTDTGDTDTGWTGFLPLTSSDVKIDLDASTQEGDWAGPFAACPDGEVTQQLEWDIMFPRGLCYVSTKSGAVGPLSVTVEVQYRDIDSPGSWTSIVKTYTQSTLDVIGFTETASLGSPIRPEFRMRRIGAKSTATNHQDVVEWNALRAKLSAPTSYDGATTIAVRVRGGHRLASQSEQLISVIATRVLPIRNGGAWDVETPTRDIAAWVAYVARSIGYTDDDIDFEELDRLGEIWAARGDYFDASIESSGTVKEWLNDALAAGFSELTLDRGLIRPVRDEPRTTFEHMYTPQNMTEGLSRQFSGVTPDDFDGVNVEYIDGITWQKETVECRIAGDVGRRVEKVTLEGVTDRTRAWRYGMRRRMMQKYRRWSYSFSTEMDALNSRYLSYCALADDVPGYGQSALMLSYDSGIIESSEPLDWSAGGSHVVGIRRPDGTMSGPYSATRIDDYRLSVTGVDFVPDTSWSIEPPHILFGPVTRWSYPALITSINPSGTDGASVEATNYDQRIYQYDDATPA